MVEAGDKNTKYFLCSANYRRLKKLIPSLVNNEGVEVFSEGAKGNIAADYFKALSRTSSPQLHNDFLHGMECRVLQEMNQRLIMSISDAEIRQAVFSIKRESAPGSDGMTGVFFQSYWSIIGSHIPQM